MDHVYDDCFPEPAPHEEEVTALIGAIRGTIKFEIQNELDNLRKENAELQDIKNRMQEINQEHRRKINELEQAKSNVVMAVRRERLADLMKNLGHELFGIDYNYEYGEKCDNCDDHRRIYFESPGGNQLSEDCKCKKNRIMIFKPRSYVACETNVRNKIVWYRPYKDDGEGFVEDTSGTTRAIVGDDKTFEEVRGSVKWLSELSFKKQGRAQEFCDWLNDQKLKEW